MGRGDGGASAGQTCGLQPATRNDDLDNAGDEAMDDTEIEQMRLEALKETLQEFSRSEAELKAQYSPGSLGCHEALHAASIAMDLFEGHVMEHPAVLINPEWFRLAAQAQEAMYALYDAIGQDHLAKTGEGR
jgi:hypothetical protein